MDHDAFAMSDAEMDEELDDPILINRCKQNFLPHDTRQKGAANGAPSTPHPPLAPPEQQDQQQQKKQQKQRLPQTNISATSASAPMDKSSCQAVSARGKQRGKTCGTASNPKGSGRCGRHPEGGVKRKRIDGESGDAITELENQGGGPTFSTTSKAKHDSDRQKIPELKYREAFDAVYLYALGVANTPSRGTNQGQVTGCQSDVGTQLHVRIFAVAPIVQYSSSSGVAVVNCI